MNDRSEPGHDAATEMPGQEGADGAGRPRLPSDALHDNHELFRALTLYSGDIISLLDGEGRLLYNSPATERINGFTSDELANIDTFEMIHPDDREHVREVFVRVLAEPGSVHTVQYRYLTKAGQWLWMEAIASNQLDNPAVRGVVANSRDVTERVNAEEEKNRMQEQMLHVQKLESLGVLAGGVAHDFNNLLMVILGESSLLLGKSPEPQILAGAQRIFEAAERASELTQLLLAYAGKGRLSTEHTSVAQLVRDMQPLLEITAGKQNRLIVELDSQPTWTLADPRQLRQVLLNLVQNAGESSSDPTSITLRVQPRVLGTRELVECVIGEALKPGPYVVLEVLDEGDGMQLEARQRIFDPFFSTKQTGRGLGLAAVSGIVNSHRAGVALQSVPGNGTWFAVYFPAVDPPEQREAQEQAERPASFEGTVLVVDDDPAAARTTCRLLEGLGMTALAASSGGQALERLERVPLRLVVLDMVMPGMDGAETFARLRQRCPNVPVLLYSGYDDEIAARCLPEPRTAFLQKPFTAEQLRDSIHALFQRTRMRG